MPNYKVTYFNARGRGEIIRLMMAAAGQKFEDERLEFNEWPARKSGTPWGGLPVLEVDGKQIGQSVAVVSYIAHQYGLSGSGAFEHALVESVVISIIDLYNDAGDVVMGRATEAQKEKLNNNLPNTFKHLENLISQHGHHGHAVGHKLTAADVAIFYIVDCLQTGNSLPSDVLDKFSHILSVVEKVHSQEKILTYIKNRPTSRY